MDFFDKLRKKISEGYNAAAEKTNLPMVLPSGILL